MRPPCILENGRALRDRAKVADIQRLAITNFLRRETRLRRRDGKTLSYVPTKESIQKYLQDANVEILVLVEGYDPTTSCNVQRNASYTSNDIMWNHKFVPCVSRTNREVVVDMNAFHKTMKLT